jgi:hypothetical protein
MERALKSVKAAGFEEARIVMDLNARTIEIHVGKTVAVMVEQPTPNEWSRE